MMSSKETIRFNLQGVSTEQYAPIGEAPQTGETVTVTTTSRFGVDRDKRKIGVFMRFTFLSSNESPFLQIECGCHFQIEENDWKEITDYEKNLIILPKGFAIHLLMLCTGTTRGILYSKTENTPYNKFFIPLINVTELVESDVIIHFEYPTVAPAQL